MATDAAQTLAENVQWVIENSGWDSQAKLAKAAGIDQKTISRIVNRANMPTLDKLIALAKTMRIEPWQLLTPDFGSGLYRIDEQRKIVPASRPTVPGRISEPAFSPPASKRRLAA